VNPERRQEVLALGSRPLEIRDVVRVAAGQLQLELDPAARRAMLGSTRQLARALDSGQAVYGVTTGFGDSCTESIPPAERHALALNLVRFHGAGLGPLFSEAESRAITVARLACLVRGYSAVRPQIVEHLLTLLNAGVVAAIPALGSVGASGDLTPLSYVAAVLLGEREVLWKSKSEPARPHLQRLGLQPLTLEPKESLALMNGTSAMTGIACLALERARRLCRWCAALSAVNCDVLLGQPGHFAAELFSLKPHPGQALAAAWIRADVGQRSSPAPMIQDRYSLRCAPHVIGVALDVLTWASQWVEIELNSVNDNPIVSADAIYHGGHFYGGHVCQAMDSLKVAVANLADLLDRQLLHLCDPRSNRGLPANLARGSTAHHGFKALQITASALTAEALKLTTPASVFSRSTENHNQDKVSMGTIAARDCQSILDHVERVAAITTLAAVQATELRATHEHGPRARALVQSMHALVPANTADRRMDVDVVAVLDSYSKGLLALGELDDE
jgi:histidine ammonia-lyase